MDNFLYQEEQTFRGSALWFVVAGGLLLGMALMLYGMVQQLILGNTVGSNPVSDETLLGMGIAVIALLGGMLWLAYYASLITRVSRDGVHVRYLPFHRRDRIFRWADITEYEIRTYNPLREFGGWGIRFNFSGGRAYSIRGNQGVQLSLAQGGYVLIGSEQPEVFAAAIDRIMKA